MMWPFLGWHVTKTKSVFFSLFHLKPLHNTLGDFPLPSLLAYILFCLKYICISLRVLEIRNVADTFGSEEGRVFLSI